MKATINVKALSNKINSTDISGDRIVATQNLTAEMATINNSLTVGGDLSGNNAMLYDVCVNRLWIGQVEMLGYIPGNIATESAQAIAELQGNLRVIGNTELQGVTINNTLDVSSVDISNNLTVAGAVLLQSGADISGTLDVSSVDISNNLTVAGAVLLQSGADISGTLDVSNVNVSGNVGIGVYPEQNDKFVYSI